MYSCRRCRDTKQVWRTYSEDPIPCPQCKEYQPMTQHLPSTTNGNNADPLPQILENVVVKGDLAGLNAAQRTTYYNRLCETLGLNPLTQPFSYITFQGKLVLYARRECTEQLRKLNRISITIVAREHVEDLYIVTARATTPDNRTDESIGAVNLAGLKGEQLANAIMKAETKAKRRVTLSISGLGMLDESEVDSIPDARPVAVQPAPQALPSQQHEEEPRQEQTPDPFAEYLSRIQRIMTLERAAECFQALAKRWQGQQLLQAKEALLKRTTWLFVQRISQAKMEDLDRIKEEVTDYPFGLEQRDELSNAWKDRLRVLEAYGSTETNTVSDQEVAF